MSEFKAENKNIDPVDISLPSQKILRRMDLLVDQSGIYRRYMQEKEHWELHLNNTKDFICKAIAPDTDKTIAILGSGWMLDVPVDYLLQNFREVYFFDLNHPNKVKWEIRNRNAYFIEADLTGGLLEEAYRCCSFWKKSKPENILQFARQLNWKLPVDADFIVSVNLLNQLDILLIDYLKKHFRLKPEFIRELRKTIQKNHVGLLVENKAVIVTDHEELRINDQGLELDKKNLLYCTLPQGIHQQEWIWEFDTRKTYNPAWKTYFKVIAKQL